MYLRWSTQRYQKRLVYESQLRGKTAEEAEHISNTVRLTLRLVESARVTGKPRQRTIAYLGSLNESKRREADRTDVVIGVRVHTSYDTEARYYFWHQVDDRLDALVKREVITADQRDRFTAQIAERIPQLTADERATREVDLAAGRELVAHARAYFRRG